MKSLLESFTEEEQLLIAEKSKRFDRVSYELLLGIYIYTVKDSIIINNNVFIYNGLDTGIDASLFINDLKKQFTAFICGDLSVLKNNSKSVFYYKDKTWFIKYFDIELSKFSLDMIH